MKKWEVTCLDGAKIILQGDEITFTPSGVALFIAISQLEKDENGKPTAKINAIAGNTFKVIKEVTEFKLAEVTNIKTGSVHVTI